jgi:amidase
VAADPNYHLRMSWNFLSRSTLELLDWVDRLGPEVTLDKRTLANTRTGWMLSQNTLRKARAHEGHHIFHDIAVDVSHQTDT